jgi:hypothetical protein
MTKSAMFLPYSVISGLSSPGLRPIQLQRWPDGPVVSGAQGQGRGESPPTLAPATTIRAESVPGCSAIQSVDVREQRVLRVFSCAPGIPVYEFGPIA